MSYSPPHRFHGYVTVAGVVCDELDVTGTLLGCMDADQGERM